MQVDELKYTWINLTLNSHSKLSTQHNIGTNTYPVNI